MMTYFRERKYSWSPYKIPAWYVAGFFLIMMGCVVVNTFNAGFELPPYSPTFIIGVEKIISGNFETVFWEIARITLSVAIIAVYVVCLSCYNRLIFIPVFILSLLEVFSSIDLLEEEVPHNLERLICLYSYVHFYLIIFSFIVICNTLKIKKIYKKNGFLYNIMKKKIPRDSILVVVIPFIIWIAIILFCLLMRLDNITLGVRENIFLKKIELKSLSTITRTDVLLLQYIAVKGSLPRAKVRARGDVSQGNAKAQALLGVCLLEGVAVKKNEAEAVKWFRKSAEQGNSQGQACLGDCYFQGIGVEKNEAEAVKWFRKSAEQGNSQGQACLGLCYLRGFGVEKNVTEAKKWLWKSAEQGNTLAIDILKSEGWW